MYDRPCASSGRLAELDAVAAYRRTTRTVLVEGLGPAVLTEIGGANLQHRLQAAVLAATWKERLLPACNNGRTPMPIGVSELITAKSSRGT